jgi:hypothetical protein
MVVEIASGWWVQLNTALLAIEASTLVLMRYRVRRIYPTPQQRKLSADKPFAFGTGRLKCWLVLPAPSFFFDL